MWEKPLITWRKNKVWHTTILCSSPFLWLHLKLPFAYRFVSRIREFEASEFVGLEGAGHAKMGGVQRSWKRWKSWAQQEGLWKGTPCKHRLLFQGLDEESCDPSGISDETVRTITNNTPTGAREYTKDIFSCWTLTHTYVLWFILWKMLHVLPIRLWMVRKIVVTVATRKCGKTIGVIHECKLKRVSAAQWS